MGKITYKNSLRFRSMAMMIGFLVLLSFLIIAYNLYIYQIMNQQIDLTLKNSLKIYTQEAEQDLNNIEAFLLNKCLNRNTIRQIQDPVDDLERYLAILELQDTFETSISTYNLMDGLFLYDSQNDIYVAKEKHSDQKENKYQIEKHMDSLIEKFNTNAQTYQNEWFSKQIGEKFFLLKMFELQNVYIGCWMQIDTVLEKLQTLSIQGDDYVLMLDAEQTVLEQNFPIDIIDTAVSSVILDNKKYKIISSEYKCSSFSFLVLRRTDNFFALLNGAGTQILLALVLSFSTSMVIWWVEIKFFFQPLNNLIDAMNQLKQGNMEISLHDKNVFDEFQILNDTFDSMTKEIKKLKIEVYEEMLNKQRAELLYLQEQINPHFLTNCMSLIRNLSIIGDNENVQKASVLVSNHIRYALATSTLTPLSKELMHVKNYEELQKMRYGDQFILTIKKQKGLEQCQVPTMLIQVFVDNAVKHQLDPNHQLNIVVEIRQEQTTLYISVWDSGEGFAPQILSQLQKHEALINDDGEHVGIYNVCQRLDILYGKQAHISFSNMDQGGAKIDIQIPVKF